MIDRTQFHYQLECSRTSATIYIGGDACAERHIARLTKLVNDLPRTTRVLRVDLHGVFSMNLQTLMELRAMMARWRSERNAHVRLLLRAPLPRAEWPTSAIQFERAPLRLVVPSRQAELMEMVLHRGRGQPSSRTTATRRPKIAHMQVTSAGAL